jgi:hypothetical protein
VSIFQVGILGFPRPEQIAAFRETLLNLLADHGIASLVSIATPDESFDPRNDFASVAVYFGVPGMAGDDASISRLMNDGTAVVPVVPDLKSYSRSVPSSLRPVNGLELSSADPKMIRVCTAALEAMKLLPRQRRLFLSYRQAESRSVALQLFEHLSSKNFEVFLDTHGVPVGSDFQEVLWHRLSDSDALIMLDTPGYFESRWTSQEFGHALAKSFVPLRIGWPGVVPHRRSLAAVSMQLEESDFDAPGSFLTKSGLHRVTLEIERVRSRGLAVRNSEMLGAIRVAVLKVGGEFVALGPNRAMVLRLACGRGVKVMPAVGVPNAENLHEAALLADQSQICAVVYDDAGVAKKWKEHLDWLGVEIRSARWLTVGHAAWQLANWTGETT